MDARDPAVRLQGITKKFDHTIAIDDLFLDIAPQEFFAILGPSGCGKTTTLRSIAGLEIPDSGSVELFGEEITFLPPYRRDVNTVFQSYALFPHMTVKENVAFGLKRKRLPKTEIATRVGRYLAMVGLTHKADRQPHQLSGGQQQRVALARALVNEPKVLLLDEPLGALDLELRQQMQVELKRLQKDLGITFIHVTHDQDEALAMADRLAIMNNGRLEQLGEPNDVYENPASRFVANFMGISNLIEATVVGKNGDYIELASRGADRLLISSQEPLVQGSIVAISIRPEKATCHLEHGAELAPAHFSRVSGLLTEAIYAGTHTKLIVMTDIGVEMIVFVQNQNLAIPQAGSRVTISWDPANSRLLETVQIPETLTESEQIKGVTVA